MTNVFLLLYLAVLGLFVGLTKRYVKNFSKRNTFLLSLGLSSILLLPWLSAMIAGKEANLRDNGVPFLGIIFGNAIVIYFYWISVRHIAARAEANGRSYKSFMILAIPFTLVMFIVVSVIDNRKQQAVIIGPDQSDFVGRIKELEELFRNGSITKEEFKLAKSKVLE